MAADKEIIDCLQLINSDNVGPVTFYKLLAKFGSAEEAVKNLPRLKKLGLFPRAKAELELARAKEQNIKILLFKDAEFPQALRQLEDCPPLIYAKGNIKCLQHPMSLSIVGARNATIKGRKTASRIAYELTNNGIMIVSGMARGIDAASHKGAMYAQGQNGATIAVLGTGVDVAYPQENTELYRQIVKQGVVISEFPLGTQPQSNNFPRRNRIVAALSLGTLVIEATLHSGSLITAKLALEQGKDIFAVPGTPDDPRAAGPNRLIKDGAVLVENSDDILQVLCANNTMELKAQMALPLAEPHPVKISPPLSIAENKPATTIEQNAKIIDYLDYEGITVDEVIRASGKDAAEVAMALLELELDGKIVRQPGDKVALLK